MERMADAGAVLRRGSFCDAAGHALSGLLNNWPLLSPRISRVHSRWHGAQNKWLTVHVSTSIFGYAGFTLAFAAAVMWLLKRYLKSDHLITRALPGSKTLEEYMYRGAAFGFLFQSAMIITGAIWADISWGRYWGWDRKKCGP